MFNLRLHPWLYISTSLKKLADHFKSFNLFIGNRLTNLILIIIKFPFSQIRQWWVILSNPSYNICKEVEDTILVFVRHFNVKQPNVGCFSEVLLVHVPCLMSCIHIHYYVILKVIHNRVTDDLLYVSLLW